MKCPNCNFELTLGNETVADKQVAVCRNPECKYAGWHLPVELWQEIIRTRKALNAAINAMKSASAHNTVNCVIRGEDPAKDDVGITINRALNKITALEQKDEQ